MSEELQRQIDVILYALNYHKGDYFDATVNGDAITFRAFVNETDNEPYKVITGSLKAMREMKPGMFAMLLMNMTWVQLNQEETDAR